jgi:hypothetical protein
VLAVFRGEHAAVPERLIVGLLLSDVDVRPPAAGFHGERRVIALCTLLAYLAGSLQTQSLDH